MSHHCIDARCGKRVVAHSCLLPVYKWRKHDIFSKWTAIALSLILISSLSAGAQDSASLNQFRFRGNTAPATQASTIPDQKSQAKFSAAIPQATVTKINGREYQQFNFISTTPSSYTSPNSRVETECAPVSGTQQVNCTSQQRAYGTVITLISTVSAPDGTLYQVVCRQGVLGGMGEGMAVQSGATAHRGCDVLPGTYLARWDRRSLRVLHTNRKGKQVETIFSVLSSQPAQSVQATSVVMPAIRDEAQVIITSNVSGADIEVDGSFVGNAPSVIPLGIGEHLIAVKKSGYTPWQREVKVTGGAINIQAALQPN